MHDRRPISTVRYGLFLLLLLLAPTAARGETLNEVRGLVLSGDRVRARAVLDSLLSRDTALDAPARASAAFLRATLEEDGDQLERRLLEFLNREGGHASDHAAAHLALGRLSLSQGRVGEAVTHFRDARDAGLEEEGSLWLGLASLVLGDVATARSALERAASSGSSRLRQRALLALGDLERLRNEWERARHWYAQVLGESRQGPGWWATAAWREAECLENLGNLPEARERLRELLERFPEAYEAPLARARLRMWEEPAGPPSPQPATGPAPEVGTPSAAAGFGVQVGAFSLEENAVRLADDLRNRGFVRVRVLGGEGLHRVVVGSFPDRPAAEAMADSLGAALRASVSIVPLDGKRP